ncbi:hypothetical protein [Bifidobacterium magnum]|uniref:Uncharacterized protein n=1 Tax=Bifidobacterium magnum TaxID=1692 RepID=A0A087B9M8_9BIFI|nr:hypothetical protein [Bifidobacterium magnum]KFI67728.1 hypothetical protein BMAGN_1538 [Bifidobacterium magnum]
MREDSKDTIRRIIREHIRLRMYTDNAFEPFDVDGCANDIADEIFDVLKEEEVTP